MRTLSMRSRFFAGITILLAVVMLAPATTIHAAPSPKTITISPFLSEVQLQPSDISKVVTITVTNTTSQSQEFAVSAIDFGSLNTSGGLAFEGGDVNTFMQKYGLAKWLHLSADQINLDAGKTVQFSATVTNDEALGPGGHYAAVILSSTTTNMSSNDSVSIQPKISALIFATKSGGEVYDMHLAKLTHDSTLVHLPDVYTLTFQNNGNVHVVPRGTLKVVDPLGRAVGRGIINEASAYALPQTSRDIAVQPQVMAAMAWLPGTYKVQVDYRYDGHAAFATKMFSFIYVGPVSIVGTLLIVALLGFYTFRIVRHRTKPEA